MMRTIYCQECYIKFNDKTRNDVAISYVTIDTRCRYLKVDSDGTHIVVQFCDKDGDSVKEIVYNFNSVLEINCSGWINPDIIKGN